MKEEWKSIFQSTWIKVVLIAIMIIPMTYAGIFLGSMWDPYGNADKIPVAVVNQDKSVIYQKKQLQIGKDLVSNLKENKAMDFHFVSSSKATQGLKDGTYYMVITIPEKFSENATTLLEKYPKKMVLTYETNPGTNYIASKMDETAIRKIKESVSQSVTETYADTLFDQVKTLSSGLQEASDGSLKLSDGVTQTMQGNKTINDNLLTLASSTLTFQEGAKTFDDGLKSYTDGVLQLTSGSDDLNTGMKQFQDKSSLLADGVNALSSGSAKLQDGIASYSKGVDTLTDAVNTLTQNNAALKEGAQQIAYAGSDVSDGTQDIAEALSAMSYSLSSVLSADKKAELAALIQYNDTLRQKNESYIQAVQQNTQATDEEKQIAALLQSNNDLLYQNAQAVQSLQAGLSNIQNVLDRKGTTKDTMGLLQAMTQLQNGVNAIDQGMNSPHGFTESINDYLDATAQLQQGLSQLSTKSATLNQGVNDVYEGSGQLYGQMPALQDGITQLYDGSQTLLLGSTVLTQNNQTLLQGSTQLFSGSKQIANGAHQLADGSKTLGNGLSSLKDGSHRLSTLLQNGANQSNLDVQKETKDMFATPLRVQHKEISTVESNGKAMAPYMMSVGLYVACMAFTLMYPLLENNIHTASGIKLWMSKAGVMYVISTIMAVVMVIALTLINGLSPLQMVKTIAIAVLISAAFMSMIVFFNITCGKIGAFIVLIFMVFQLGGAAGTYPIETSNAFYQAIHPFMPFTYSVDAFRHTLAIGDPIRGDVLVFVGMILIFSALSILFYRWKVSISDEQFAKTKLAQFH